MQRLILILIVVVLVGIAGFALLWFGIGRELRPLAAKALVDCRDGKHAEVYAQAHERLRENRSLEQFQAWWTYVERELGAFREILRPVGVSTSSTSTGTRKAITLELGLQKGKALATFWYVITDAEPQLLHIWIGRSPDGKAAQDDRAPLERAVRALMARYNASDWAGFYGSLSCDLQMAWPQRALTAQLSELRGATAGAFEDLTVSKTADGEDDAVVYTYEVRFEKRRMTFEITHRFDDGAWDIVGFEIR